MNKISSIQLFTLLLGVNIFTIICSVQQADSNQMAGAALSVLMQLLASLPIILIYRKKNFSLSDELLLGKAGKLIYALFFILWGASAFGNLWGVTKSVYFPINSSLAGAVILGSVSLYAATLGIKAVSRYSTIMVGLIALCAVVMIIGAFPKAEAENFVPDITLRGMIKSAVKSFCSSGELVMLFILLDLTKGNRERGTFSFFAAKLVITEIILAGEIAVLGRIMTITDYPFFTAGAFSQPMSIQRADSLYMILFTMLCVMTVTLLIWVSSSLLLDVFSKFKYPQLFVAAVMAGLSALIQVTGIDPYPISGILIIILAVIFPLIMFARRKGKNEKNNSHIDDGSAQRMQL